MNNGTSSFIIHSLSSSSSQLSYSTPTKSEEKEKMVLEDFEEEGEEDQRTFTSADMMEEVDVIPDAEDFEYKEEADNDDMVG